MGLVALVEQKRDDCIILSSQVILKEGLVGSVLEAVEDGVYDCKVLSTEAKSAVLDIFVGFHQHDLQCQIFGS